jgi:hypothetical protein
MYDMGAMDDKGNPQGGGGMGGFGGFQVSPCCRALVCLYLGCLTLSVSFCASRCLCLSLARSLSISLFLSLSLSRSFSLSRSLFPISLPPSLSPSLTSFLWVRPRLQALGSSTFLLPIPFSLPRSSFSCMKPQGFQGVDFCFLFLLEISRAR